jgi:hypothetical protein
MVFLPLPPTGLCPRIREHAGARPVTSTTIVRFLGLLRTEKSNNDSALSKQLPVVLKLLPT